MFCLSITESIYILHGTQRQLACLVLNDIGWPLLPYKIQCLAVTGMMSSAWLMERQPRHQHSALPHTILAAVCSHTCTALDCMSNCIMPIPCFAEEGLAKNHTLNR